MKHISSLLLFSLVIIACISCKKDPQPTTPKVPDIKVSSDFSGVSYYKSCIVTLVLKNTTNVTSDFPGSESLTSNSESETIVLNTPKLTKTITYHFIAHGDNGQADSANVTIHVNDPIAPTIFLYVDNDTIIRGTLPSSVKITWNSNTDSISSPELSGVKGKSGTISVSPTETTIYHFISKNDGLTVSDSIRITVKDPPPPPPPTDEELISVNYGPWKQIKLEFQQPLSGSPWIEYAIWECSKDNLYYFYLTPTKKIVNDRGLITCSDDETRILEGTWSLSGKVLKSGGDFNIITLTKDTLVWVYGTGEKVRETFVHP
ncbi:MAG: hypothetical protein Q7U54_04865 [Bacteroidales bacterium]|nr:hypothetical protein [Bacteroidales bacterium]